MAKKTTTAATAVAAQPAAAPAANVPRPRLHKLQVSNFRCIGATPVVIELDDIVVLVGPNNAGKSSILRAYQVAMSHGSGEGELSIDDFPNAKPDAASPPTIELETVVFDKTAPGEKWVRTDTATGDMFVRERWTWTAPGEPKKVGWDVAANDWHAKEGPWGAPNVAKGYRPQPHHVSAFHSPEEQAKEVLALLTKALTDRVKDLSKKKAATDGTEQPSDYEKLLDAVKGLQKAIATDALAAVDDVCKDLGGMIAEVFPGYAVTFDARPEDGIDKSINLFKASPLLKMGPANGHQTTIHHQGSGACRTLLWTALRILAERKGKADASERPHLLLMDEPEICLHPDAIRDACRVLYDLPKKKNWQVMITTHSPVFIDLSRDNTSIVRVERDDTGKVEGTTIYRPARSKLDDNDKKELKMLNLCDPYVAEFFFGGRTIVVEGDTEYTAFKFAIGANPAAFRNVHVVRARGKYCIVSLCKVLNQFEKRYAVLHDADREKTKKGAANPAWKANEQILEVTKTGRDAGRIRLIASVPDFETAYFGAEAKEEKPYEALRRVRDDAAALGKVTALLDTLLDSAKPLPAGALAWADMASLGTAVNGNGATPPAGPVTTKA